jgi:hypothetical protein
MDQKLNKVVHDPRTGTIYISLRPKSKRRPSTSLEHPGRTVLDLDAEGDIYGVRLLGVGPEDAQRILELLKAGSGRPPGGPLAEDPRGDGGPA